MNRDDLFRLTAENLRGLVTVDWITSSGQVTFRTPRGTTLTIDGVSWTLDDVLAVLADIEALG